MKCITCGGYYKTKKYDVTFECPECRDVIPNLVVHEMYGSIDDINDVDLKQVVNPSGRTPAYIYD